MVDPLPALKTHHRIFHRNSKLLVVPRSQPYQKYSKDSNLVKPNTFAILGEGAPEALHETIQGALSASVTTDSNSKYKVAMNMLNKCQEQVGRQIGFPLSEQDVCCFVAYMVSRNVTDKTIYGYLAGLRLASISKGFPCDTLVSPMVKQILKGLRNLKENPKQKVESKTRRAMTFVHLKLLGHAIGSSGYSEFEKDAIWAVSLSAFWGSFRLGELMNKRAGETDPKYSCLLSDFKFTSEGFKIWVRSPKVASPEGDLVEVFAVPGSIYDPLKAMEKYVTKRRSMWGVTEDSVLFAREDGTPINRDWFNNILHKLLDPLILDARDSFTGHSFRAGISTLMKAAGMEESDIKIWGRWSSQAYQLYCKKKGLEKGKIWSRLHEIVIKQ